MYLFGAFKNWKFQLIAINCRGSCYHDYGGTSTHATRNLWGKACHSNLKQD